MPNSDQDSWRQIEELFHSALALEASSRETWLREVTGGDEHLVSRVLELLAADDARTGEGIVSRVVGAAMAESSVPATQDWIGREVGAYRLLAELGHGGMGTVYLASRIDDAYRAQVAIKFVRGGIAGPELLRRLVAERQILADLAHPNIPRLLDGGTAADGTPYLVMEYIDGTPVDRHCAAQRLDLPARLRLFVQICAAVQHAHQALVIHRDLKPSNILVTADGTPKLVDFGIAKLLANEEGVEETLTGRGAMTIAYASPEQVRGQRVTVTSDVYSLGTVLYLLLTGRLPLIIPSGTALPEVIRRLGDEEPLRPSTVASGVAAEWSSALVGDLDAIVLKSIAKEPARRYQSVEQFASDIERYLHGELVQARPASARYRLHKFLKRNRTAVLAAGVVFLALATGLALAQWQRGRAEQARRATEAALAQSNATRDFLLRLFRANDPRVSKGHELTALDLLARGLAKVDSLGDQPALQAELLHILGRIELELSNYDRGADLLRRSVAVHRRIGSSDSALVDVYAALGNAMNDLGWPDSAAIAWQTAVDLGARSVGEERPSVVGVLGNLGIAYARMGQPARAESTYRRQITIERRVLRQDDPQRASGLNNLALLYMNQGRFDEADPLFKECLHVMQAGWGDSIVTTAFGYDNYGVMLREAGRYDEAEPLLRKGLEIRRRLLGDTHRYAGASYFSLGLMMAERGRGNDYQQADSLLHLALETYRASLGADHPAIAYAMHGLGVLAYNRGRLKEAEHWFQAALDLRRKNRGRDDPAVTVQSLIALGHTLRDEHSASARTIFKAADSLARARLSPDHPMRRRAEIGYALTLADEGDQGRAEPEFTDGLSGLAGRIGARHPYVQRACARGASVGLSATAICM